jgi:hypothetical protein
MDPFELSDAQEQKHRKKSSALVWNVLTILVFVIILCVISASLLIFLNPYVGINPFPPPTLYPSVPPPTITVTPRITLIPSWTPTNALEATQTLDAANIPISTVTPSARGTTSDVVIATPQGGYSFMPREGSPSVIDGSTFHPDVGCNWSGVAGQATSLNGESLKGLFVQLGGSIPGVDSVDSLAMTGLAPQYGEGGFEFTISDKLVASTGTLWIQLLDQQNLPLSDRVYFDTYNDCQKNLIIIYFDQVK